MERKKDWPDAAGARHKREIQNAVPTTPHRQVFRPHQKENDHFQGNLTTEMTRRGNVDQHAS